MQQRKPRKALKIIAILLAVLLMLAAAALYNGLVSRRYAVKSNKLTNDEPIRIAVLADLHSYTHGKDQASLVRRVERMKPDLICLVGDMADHYYPIEGTQLLLDGITGLAPCIYVTGNHEHWGDIDFFLSVFENAGVTILRNESMKIEIKGQTLMFYGVDDTAYTRTAEYGQFFDDMPPLDADAYNILLSHRPDPVETYAQQGFDLVFSGHAHGGQVRIPLFVNGLFAPDQGWFPQYAGGLYRVGETTMVISRGLFYYPDLPRVFNPPEVVLVSLCGAR